MKIYFKKYFLQNTRRDYISIIEFCCREMSWQVEIGTITVNMSNVSFTEIGNNHNTGIIKYCPYCGKLVEHIKET